MKGLKIFTVIALSVLLIIGWMTFAVDKGSKIVSYNSNVSTADQYVEEGLYQRAIQKYKEALKYNDSEKTWTKMFKAYDLRYKEDARILSDYITDLNVALELYPKNISYVQQLYELHMSSKNLEKAYECLNLAIENGVNDEKVISQVKELKYSFNLDYNTYSDFRSISSSSYFVYNCEKWVYIDPTGEELTDYKYVFASSLNEDKTRIIETTLGARLTDSEGVVLGIFKSEVSDAGLFSDGLIPAFCDGKYSYYDSFAKEQFGGYEYAGTFQNGIAATKKDGKWMLIDTNGETIESGFVDIKIDDNGRHLRGEVIVAAKEEGKFQMFDEKGKIVDNFTASNMDLCMSDGLIAYEKDGKWGYVDTSGKTIIDPEYENAKSFSRGLAAVCKDGKWGFINTSNELVIDYQFAGADYFNSNGSCMVRYDAPEADDEILWQLLVLNFDF